MVEFGSHPNIRRGIYTLDGDINLLFILVVSTLVYFNACFFFSYVMHPYVHSKIRSIRGD